MKNTMSALDIKICLEELRDISGSWTGKIYEIQGTFLLKLNPPEKSNTQLIVEPGRRIHLTEMKHPTPKHPSSFAMLLRKHLTNSKLTEIRQPDMERIIELKFERKKDSRILIAEIFGAGNLLLCDEKREIIKPYESKKWKHRELKSGREYITPPKKGKNISSVSKSDLKDTISESEDLVRGLARNLNIGGPIAEEICTRADIKKEANPREISESDYEYLHSAIRELLSAEISPQVVYENKSPVYVLPFPFKTKSKKETESFENFNQALDCYFQEVSKNRIKSKKKEKLEKKLESVKSRLKSQRKQLQELKEKIQETKKKADAISTHHEKIDAALENLKKIRKSKGWEDIEEEIQNPTDSGKEWAKIIDSVQPKGGTVIVNLPETFAELDLRESSFENASRFYDEYKRAKSKQEGTEEAIKETEKEIEKLKEEGVEAPQKEAPQKTREKMWYERYRWFYSSDENLVIAGRDEKTNQEIVEKHMESQDRYLHADLKGAPHTVVKSDGEKISEFTLEEAARFAAMHSRAWREGLNNADVYWVEPNQVNKEAPSGEYLPKGSYRIKGERNYLTVPVKAGVGLLEKEESKIPICGPQSAVTAHSSVLIEIKPGPIKKSELAHRIQSELHERVGEKVDKDELMQIFPPGSGVVVN